MKPWQCGVVYRSAPMLPIITLPLPHCSQFSLRFPFRSAAQLAASSGLGSMIGEPTGNRGSAGGGYQLTYLDDDMLIGRAVALGGSFIFTRAG